MEGINVIAALSTSLLQKKTICNTEVTLSPSRPRHFFIIAFYHKVSRPNSVCSLFFNLFHKSESALEIHCSQKI